MPAIQDEPNIGIEATLLEGHSDPYGVLRCLDASIMSYDDAGSAEIGNLTGWLGRGVGSLDPEEVWDAADSISAHAEALGAAARQILAASDRLDDVLLVDRITLEERYRGQKLMGRILDELAHVLQLHEDTLLVLTLPEPLSLDGGGRLDDGPERNAGLDKLQTACRRAGMEPWNDGPVWWRSDTVKQTGPLG
ncbi:hypothetical protein NBM05_01900 [Rothia sp. AR01]|uniref:N-acetyltransferase domain-containing protein n=1 Tax=Rothia santali TaxID=2949643 RepID=A0A9X2HAU8_9MICC|nr:hypothetical protein [Rothia santali]MCP3424815.1 hypothetical protein [Rothia santali]